MTLLQVTARERPRWSPHETGNPPAPQCDPDPSDDERVKKDLRAEAQTLHHKLTHEPYNMYCRACVYGKKCHRQHRKTKPEDKAKPEKLGDMVTGDHFIRRADEDGDKEATDDDVEEAPPGTEGSLDHLTGTEDF